MVLRKLYWVFVAAILFTLALHLLGYKVLEITLLLILSALVLSEIIRIEEKEELHEIIRNDIFHKLIGIERVLGYIFKSMNNVLTVEHLDTLHGKLLSKLEMHEARIDQKLKEELDKIARKIIEIENKISEMKNHSSLLTKRVENIENYLFEEEEL
jgi:hypothetical protein